MIKLLTWFDSSVAGLHTVTLGKQEIEKLVLHSKVLFYLFIVYNLTYLHWQDENTVPYHELPMIDRQALFQLENVVKNIREGFENYQFFKIFQVYMFF